MTFPFSPFANTKDSAAGSLMTMAFTAIESAERLAALNLNMARTLVGNTSNNAKAMLRANDPQEAATIQQSQVPPTIERAASYSRNVIDISTQAQQEMAQLLEMQFSEMQKSIRAFVELSSQYSPLGADVPLAAFQQMLQAFNQAFGNMNAATRELSEVTQENLLNTARVIATATRGTDE